MVTEATEPEQRRRTGVPSALWPWMRVLAALAVLGVLAWRLDLRAVGAALGSVGAGPAAAATAAALAIGAATTVLSARRWVLVARALGLPLRTGPAVAAYYRALFLNAVLPTGVLGDVHRAVDHGRRSGALGPGVRAVVLERTAGQAVLIAAGVLLLAALPTWWGLLDPEAAAVAVLAIATGAPVLLLWARRGTVLPRLRRAVRDMATDARATLFARRLGPRVAALSAAVLAGHVVLFLVAARTAGAAAPVVDLVPAAVVALLAMAVPANAAGWGPREAATAAAFGTAGLGAELGLATAVVYGLLALAASLPGAVLLALSRRAAAQPPRADSGGSAPKDAHRSASTAAPLRAVASDGRPTTPDAV